MRRIQNRVLGVKPASESILLLGIRTSPPVRRRTVPKVGNPLPTADGGDSEMPPYEMAVLIAKRGDIWIHMRAAGGMVNARSIAPKLFTRHHSLQSFKSAYS
jgi:hypothetical protein